MAGVIRPAAAALLLACATSLADATAERVRAQEKAYAAHIVCLKLTIASEDGAEQAEARCTGVVVKRGGGVAVVTGLVDAAVASARFLLPDGREVDAKVAGRDEDLGLMFSVPAEGAALPAPALDLSKGVEARIGDPLVFVDRRAEAPEDALCTPSRVICVMESPRRCYLYAGMNPDNVGGLAVTPDGALVGILGISSGTDADGDPEAFPACIPAAQIADALASLQSP